MGLFDRLFQRNRHASGAGHTAVYRTCRFEPLEERRPLAADIWLGAVYYEPATGDDSQPNTIEITFQGGAAGTELTELIIDTDKLGNGLTIGDVFFHTGPGGPGVFGHYPLEVHADGFTITSMTNATGGTDFNGSTYIKFTFSGFTAGDRLLIVVDVDEMGFLGANAVAEGNEFEGSKLTATFVTPNYQDVTQTDIFLDFYNDKLAASGLDLPDDDYMPPNNEPHPVRTAGAIMKLTPQPLPGSISGRVHADLDGDCTYDPGEPLLEGVRIDLFDAQGNLLRTTYTDANGQYMFDNLLPGTYTVFEHQPDGYLNGGTKVGSAGGSVTAPDTIGGIVIDSNVHAVNYDFCEKLPSSISGRVFADLDGDCTYDPGEPLLAGVRIDLLDQHGNLLATTHTNSQGEYKFDNLPPGTYTVFEHQPDGYLNGGTKVGSVGGTVTAPDTIGGILLISDTHGVNYDFCEKLPASISGRVHVDLNGDCTYDPGEPLLAGVRIDLLDEQGNVIATTFTNAQGVYRFDNLPAGTYGIFEHQPAGYLDGGDKIGSHGGTVVANDTFGGIVLAYGDNAVNYDFCEKPAGTISGYVFQDGAPIQVLNPQDLPNLVAQIPALRNGQRTPDDTPIAGVVMLLGDANGNPLRDAGGNLIRAVTNAAGYYEFTGLPPGVYSVIQLHPAGYHDGVDTPGSTGGIAAAIPGDIIRGIVVEFGTVSVENNFSEVRFVQMPFPFLPNDPAPPVLPPAPGGFAPPIVPPPPPLEPAFVPPPSFGRGNAIYGYTWHLSVINGGRPRANRMASESVAQLASARSLAADAWTELAMFESRWILQIGTEPDAETREVIFGMRLATPIVGDFNGDGISDLGVFYEGQWFIDLNGNGVWDEGDLWAQLGSDYDQPVAGDWDGDGKTDIGIFGRAWPGDPRHLANEPGMPAAENPLLGRTKNIPPHPDEATLGVRSMQLTSSGSMRADVIDHVFRFGEPGDIAIVGDWNGDGIATIGVFRNGEWMLDMDGDGRATEADLYFTMGSAGDRPVVGDFNGDGIDNVGIFRDGLWHIDIDYNRQLDARDLVFQLGSAGDIPVVGDWNGDGVKDPGVYQPVASGAR